MLPRSSKVPLYLHNHDADSGNTGNRAGVLGLSTALAVSKHEDIDVLVVSKHMPGDYDIEYASPWAGANYWPVGKPGSNLQNFEKTTWPELARICREVPEAGIHFQESRVYGRKKDAGTATGQWFEELCKEDAWFKDVAPNVCFSSIAPGVLHSKLICYTEIDF